MVRVDQAPVGKVNRHRIDGEVPPYQVVGDPVTEGDHWFAGVGLVRVRAEGGHLDSILLPAGSQQGPDGAEVTTHIPDRRADRT